MSLLKKAAREPVYKGIDFKKSASVPAKGSPGTKHGSDRLAMLFGD